VEEEDIWGDLDEGNEKENLFDNEIAAVPGDIWYYLTGSDEAEIKEIFKDSVEKETGYVKAYTSKKVTFNRDIHVFHGTRQLVEGREYTIAYRNNIKAAGPGDKNAPTVTIKGKGNYSGTASFTFTIEKAPMNEAVISSETEIAVMAGKSVKLGNTRPKITFEGKTLKPGTDYILEYYDADAMDSPITNPSSEILSVPGKTYWIRVIAGDNGNFTGAMDTMVKVETKDPANTISISKVKVVGVDGKALKLAYKDKAYSLEELFDNSNGKDAKAFVKYGKDPEPLVYGEDYKVVPVYDGYTYKAAGKHSFILQGIEKEDPAGKSFVGSKTQTLEITGIAMSKVKIAGLASGVEYIGRTITLEDLYNEKDKTVAAYNKNAKEGKRCDGVTLYYYDSALKKNVPLSMKTEGEEGADSADILVSRIASVNPGKFTLTFKGQNRVTGTLKKTITIKAYNLKNDKYGRLDIDVKDGVFTKGGVRPAVTVKLIAENARSNETGKEIKLKEGIDYTLTYKNNVKVADKNSKSAPCVTVKGIGNYTGTTVSKTFSITKAPISSAELVVADVAYKEKGRKGYFMPAVKVYQDGKALSVGKGKDLEAFNKADVAYTYAEATTLLDGTNVGEGDQVMAEDKVPKGTRIRVSILLSNLTLGEKSCFMHEESEKETDEIVGEYTVYEPARNISRYKVRLVGSSNIFFSNGTAVDIKAGDLEVYRKVGKNEEKLNNETDYEVKSVKNNRFLGTTTVVLKGKGDYCGTKTYTVRLLAKRIGG